MTRISFARAIKERKFVDAATIAAREEHGSRKAKTLQRAMQAAMEAREAEQARSIALKYGDYIPDSMVNDLAKLQLELAR